MKIVEIYEPIGKLVVKFQLLEMFVGVLLVELMHQDFDIGLCLTCEMSFSRLVAALVSVSEVRLDAATFEEMKVCAGQLNVCESGRNKIIHSMYFEINGELKRAKITSKRGKGLQKLFYDTDLQEIEDHVKRVEETTTQFTQFAAKLRDKGIVTNGFFRNKVSLTTMPA